MKGNRDRLGRLVPRLADRGEVFIGYVSRRGFTPFAAYRIVLGAVGLVWLLWA
jgi:hypothetical protein